MKKVIKRTRWESCQYDVFDILRFPLVVMVVFTHCTIGIPDKGSFIIDNTIDIADMAILFKIFLSKIIPTLCVPTFFFISGYLFYYNQSSFKWIVFLKKLVRRWRSLVIPYVLWILLFLIITFLFYFKQTTTFQGWIESIIFYFREQGSLRVFYDSLIIGPDSSNLPIGWKQDHSTPILFTLWYLRDLIITILFSPVLYGAIRWLNGYFILFLGGAFIFNLWPCVHGFSIVSIFYFSLGIYLSSHLKVMDIILNRLDYLIVIGGGLLSFMCLYLYYVNSSYYIYFIHIFTIIGVFFAIHIGWIFIDLGARPISLLKNSAFFIYAAHMIYVNRYCTFFVLKCIPFNNVFCGLLQYLLIPLIIVFVCLCCFCLLQKFTSPLLSLLNGGRM